MKAQIQSLLHTALTSVLAGSAVPVPENIHIEPTKDRKNGDFASNLAMMLAKPLGRPPRAVAEAVLAALPASPLLVKTEIAGPGFINFFLADNAFQAIVGDILSAGEHFGRDDSGTVGRALVEFVSANPTGPMHVGHGRGAAYGDALANIMTAAGWTVLREYYINDAGRQTDILAISVYLRYLQALGEELPFPKRGYPADYVGASAARLLELRGRDFYHPASEVLDGLPSETLSGDAEGAANDDEAKKAVAEKYADALIVRIKALLGVRYAQLMRHGLDEQLADIRGTLQAFNVRFDLWASEKETVDSGAVKIALDQLAAAGYTYTQDGALWLRTTAFGDEKDRVLIKADGAATYFVNDIAYHVDKLARPFFAGHAARLIDVWGADHHGYIARMKGAIEALTGQKDVLNVQLIQFVTLSSGRMGKRSGNFVTLQDLINEAGTDATRFFYLSRSHEQHLEFDIELARSQSSENPVYYVQYAHARVEAVFRQAAARSMELDNAAIPASLHRLIDPYEKAVLTMLGRYPETIRNAAAQSSPHLMTFYLRDLADALHKWYGASVFLVDDVELRTARLALARATQQVLRNGLGLLGVSAPLQM
jgi:arginyl-tRNA synthetase